LLNTLEGLHSEFVASIRTSVYALLCLSEEICRRAKLTRNSLGAELPLEKLPPQIRAKAAAGRRAVCFSAKQLDELGVTLDELGPFALQAKERRRLNDDLLGHSRLERQPLAYREGNVLVVLPSAVASAIQHFVIDEMSAAGAMRPFAAALANEYSRLLSSTPLLGRDGHVEIGLRGVDGGHVFAAMAEIDRGLYLNFIFLTDDLSDFAKNGLLGYFPKKGKLAGLIEGWIEKSYKEVGARPDYRGGMTLLVPCGIGRGVKPFLQEPQFEGWRYEIISAPDLLTLSWLPQFTPLTLWRMLDAEDRLAELGGMLQNINGILNMVGWARSLGGHLVPHGDIPDDMGTGISWLMIQQNSLREVRHEALTNWDVHMVQDLNRAWRRVRRDENSLFSEDRRQPFYVCEDGPNGVWPECVYAAAGRAWWARLSTSPATSGIFAFKRFKLIKTWLTRFAPILDATLQELPVGPIAWSTAFEGDISDKLTEYGQPRRSYEEALTSVCVAVGHEAKTVKVTANADFEACFLHPQNIAERALMQRTIEGFCELAGLPADAERVTSLLAQVVPNESARQQHALMASTFRDWVRGSLWAAPMTIDADDGAFIRLDLGWKYRKRSEGAEINGKEACTSYLNAVVRGLEDEVCAELRRLDRTAIIEFALMNHESAIVDRDQWRVTAAAVLALHNDREETLAVMAQHEFELSGVLQGSRLVIEFALGECPLAGGKAPARLEMSRLMAKIILIMRLGGWSDAIRWDAMEPRLRVTPFGDIHANQSFYERVIAPFGRATNDLRIQESVEKYAAHTEDPPPELAPPLAGEFPPEFWEAWHEQFGVSIEAMRQFLQMLDDRGIDARQAILRMRKSELVAACSEKSPLSEEGEALVEGLVFSPRAAWRDPPPGFESRDIFPWRFRRRLSVLRRPLIQLDERDDPELLVTPGLVGDAVQYMLGCHHRGDFPHPQLMPKMAAWAGFSTNRKGHAFAAHVAGRMEELGWQTDTEVTITMLLRKGFPVDYGDVDVLAWLPEIGRVLIIECKDVQFRKTEGEIAEQLADFRGLVNADGKKDLLRKHLDRLEVIRAHLSQLRKTLGLNVEPTIGGVLVFKNAVPMRFAWEQLHTKTELMLFSELDRL
jgi:hypothetical protein